MTDDIVRKKMEMMQSTSVLAIDAAYSAFKEALEKEGLTGTDEYDLAPKTIKIHNGLSIYKQNRGKSWMCRVTVQKGLPQIKCSTGKRSIAEAKLQAQIIERELLTKKEAGTLEIGTGPTWFEICHRVMSEMKAEAEAIKEKAKEEGKKIKPTIEAYESRIRLKLVDNPVLKNMRINNIVYADFVEAFKEDEFQDLSKTVAITTGTAISKIYEYAERKRLLTKAKPDIPNLRYVMGSETPVIEDDDMSKMLVNFENFYENSRNFITRSTRMLFPFYFQFCSSCGLRPGEEAMGLKWSNFRKGELQYKSGEKIKGYYAEITRGKTSRKNRDSSAKVTMSSREIVVYADSVKAIESLYYVRYGIKKTISQIVDEGRDELIFVGAEGRIPDFSDTFKQYVKYLKKNLKKSNYTIYSLRHEFINAQLNRGVRIQDVADQCGNSVQTIESYYKKYKAMNRAVRLLSDADMEYFKKKSEEKAEA